MSQIKLPDPLDFTQADTCWPDWKQRFERYRIATKLFKEDEFIQVGTLLYRVNPESEFVFTLFELNEKDSESYSSSINLADISDGKKYHTRTQESQ